MAGLGDLQRGCGRDGRYECNHGGVLQALFVWRRAQKAHWAPDVMNKLFVMTRGGLSKATKEIHVSEDVFWVVQPRCAAAPMTRRT
jgi:hypothetical protein